MIAKNEDGEPIGSYIVSKRIAETWGLSEDDVFLVAEQSNLTPFSFNTEYLIEVIGEATGYPLDILKNRILIGEIRLCCPQRIECMEHLQFLMSLHLKMSQRS